jgi:hypothetical protein
MVAQQRAALEAQIANTNNQVAGDLEGKRIEPTARATDWLKSKLCGAGSELIGSLVLGYYDGRA